MNKLRVELGERSYDILIEPGLLDNLGEAVAERLKPSRVVVVSDENVGAIYAERVVGSLKKSRFATEAISFPAGEDSKSLGQLSKLYDKLFELGLDRKSCLVALGGGVTGDLVGFLASTFMRGIPFVQVPTSLLAQVDSSSGGKTGINHPAGKNLIGAFHQPSLVAIDPQTLTTLPKEELLSGLGEVVKHGVIRDEKYFELVESNTEKILALDMELMGEVIHGSCRIKAQVVRLDEREGGIRALLNYGHTFAHAYESLSNYGMRHGEAVSVGMVAACHLAESICGLPENVRTRLQSVLEKLGMPSKSPEFSLDELMEKMRGDKKAEHGRLRLVLPKRIGEAEIITVEDETPIREAFRKCF